jgi:hypothetical protein
VDAARCRWVWSVRRALGLGMALTLLLGVMMSAPQVGHAQATAEYANGCYFESDATASYWAYRQCPTSNGWWTVDVNQNGVWQFSYFIWHYGDGGYLVQAPNGNQILVHPDGTVEYFDLNGFPTTQGWLDAMDNGGSTTPTQWLQDTSGWGVADVNAIFGGYLNQRWLAITCTTPGYYCP